MLVWYIFERLSNPWFVWAKLWSTLKPVIWTVTEVRVEVPLICTYSDLYESALLQWY